MMFFIGTGESSYTFIGEGNMDAKRGVVPEDKRNFSPEALELLQRASRYVFYLINEGYDLKQATVFVGNHFIPERYTENGVSFNYKLRKRFFDNLKRQL